MADRAFIHQAHRQGKDVYVWTVNEPVAMSRLMSLGVDGIITDDPALARTVLSQRAGLSSVERLLLELVFLAGLEPEDRGGEP